jgi:YD repeat-containing protein
MQRLATYVEVGLLVPAIALLATAARDDDPPAPAIDIAM